MTTVFVAGGAGGVGEGIVRAWLGTGASVGTLSRSPDRLAALTASAQHLDGALIAEEGSASDPATLAAFADRLGPIDQVVASIGGGGWHLASLAQTAPAMFARIIDDGITAHWSLATLLMPRIVEGGEYVFINGGAALQIAPGTGPLSLVAQAQLALADIFRAEASPLAPRVTSLILNSPIATSTRQAPPSAWLSPEDVGQACVALRSHPRLPHQIILNDRADVAALGQ